ncbi:hypothetical protein KSU1_A0011 [Candidatus Jettenia caeni]|uniref:Uncharacterized protein n=1 Tax=Candidatus Jettenia caeni TaxID=247490 RepID=I3IGD3_9BACT|nr:hypothetical protein KSU1_A0011 [Candidatus Jettenia caeni]
MIRLLQEISWTKIRLGAFATGKPYRQNEYYCLTGNAIYRNISAIEILLWEFIVKI